MQGVGWLSPSASSQASRAATVEPAKKQGCVSGLETWEWEGGGALRLASLGEFATLHGMMPVERALFPSRFLSYYGLHDALHELWT